MFSLNSATARRYCSVSVNGYGKCKHPFRYWLAANEERWRQDPLAQIFMPELFYASPPP